jgi:hypothetical protein
MHEGVDGYWKWLGESRQQEASESLNNEDARQTRAPHAPPRRVVRGMSILAILPDRLQLPSSGATQVFTIYYLLSTEYCILLIDMEEEDTVAVLFH